MSKDRGSKDKGSKNQKKAPADPSSGKKKSASAYKSESKNGYGSKPAPDVFVPKSDPKSDGKRKS
ncbi:MAG: hypothetical protein IPL46_26245 [Saprospiraceae bacterium]|nr:hypothetical protein [Saprospiraceae bacterium]